MDRISIHKRRKAAQICVCVGVLVLFVFSAFFNGINAYALNSDYLDEAKWYGNKNVSEEEINLQSAGNSLGGTFKYYIDNNNMCVYTYFFLKENTLSYGADDVRIAFVVNTPDESYFIAVNKDGICDAGSAEEELFTAAQNFNLYSDLGMFIAALDYNGKSPEFTVDVELFVNGKKYIIKKDMKVQIPSEEKAQEIKEHAAKNTTSAKSTTKREKKEVSTKYTPKYKGTKRLSGDEKFTPSGTASTTQESTNEGAQPRQPQITSSLSKSSKGLLILSGAFALSGITLILIATAKRNTKEEEKD